LCRRCLHKELLSMDADQIRGLKPRLDEYLSKFHDCFQRSDTRQHLGVDRRFPQCENPPHFRHNAIAIN